jgi:hypothetical protein
MRGIKGRKNQSDTCQQKEANKTNSDYPLFTSYLLTPLKQKMIATTYLLMQSQKKNNNSEQATYRGALYVGGKQVEFLTVIFFLYTTYTVRSKFLYRTTDIKKYKEYSYIGCTI